jgi:hypothetical protein
MFLGHYLEMNCKGKKNYHGLPNWPKVGQLASLEIPPLHEENKNLSFHEYFRSPNFQTIDFNSVFFCKHLPRLICDYTSG